MTRPEPEHDSYWMEDIALTEARVFDENTTIRLRWHEQAEHYTGRERLISLRHSNGPARYFNGQPYLLIPDITLTATLDPQPAGRRIGTVSGSTWQGMRPLNLGSCRAWHYPADATLILWDVDLHGVFRADAPEDGLLPALWDGWERLLLDRCPDVRRIATPAWEPEYDHMTWKRFLISHGYHRETTQAFGKTPPTARADGS